jgi:hypothetical protein
MAGFTTKDAMNDYKSNFNGLEFKKPAAITAVNESVEFRKNMLMTEGSRLFAPVTVDAAAPKASGSAVFGMPQTSNIEFAADTAKREKKEAQAANLAKARAARGNKESVGTIVE